MSISLKHLFITLGLVFVSGLRLALDYCFVFSLSLVKRTLPDFLTFGLYASSQSVLKLSLNVRGHFVTLIEGSMSLITGHNCEQTPVAKV